MPPRRPRRARHAPSGPPPGTPVRPTDLDRRASCHAVVDLGRERRVTEPTPGDPALFAFGRAGRGRGGTSSVYPYDA